VTFDSRAIRWFSEVVGHVKVHVTFKREVADDVKARAEALEEIQRVSGMTDVNHKRFERYGLLSGLVEESKLDRIRGVKGVNKVEPDQTRYLS
jgi:hypothetical protein